MALVKYNNNSISAITTAGTLATGAMVLIYLFIVMTIM